MRTLLLVGRSARPPPRRATTASIERIRYREAGVPLYWVIDGEERTVEIWTPSDEFPVVERELLLWHPPGAGLPFALSLEELFRPL